MMMGSFLFKQRAREALKGNWQTALVVTFFSTALVTLAQVLQSVTLADVQSVLNSLQAYLSTLPQTGELSLDSQKQLLQLYDMLLQAVAAVPQTTMAGLLGLNAAALLLSPVFSVSCSLYFICRIKGEEIGFVRGLFGRMPIFFKALWLHVRMFVQIALWSLLFIIPGIIAALRYSMAVYFLAEEPSISAGEAIRRSKAVMKNRKFSYFMLLFSFVGWNLLISLAQILLLGLVGQVITLVAAQFMTLWVSTYMNASCAAFYRTVSHPAGMDELLSSMRSRMRQAGMSESDIHAAGFGEPTQIPEEDETSGGEEE